jgi:hypothetical protein
MGQAPGIITEILTKVNYCELCDKPSASENVCDVYTIEKIGACDPADFSKNIIVLCPACKNKYDTGVVSKKHLKVCVIIRDPGLSEWLSNLFDRYNIRFEQNTVKQGLIEKTLNRLAANQNNIDNAIFFFGAFIIIIGILIFSYGFTNVSNYDNTAVLSAASDSGQYSPEHLFSLFLELAGVVFALMGLFFVLGKAGDEAKNFLVD